MRRRHNDRPAGSEFGPPKSIRRWRPGADVSLARFVVTPETRSAVHAVRRLASAVVAGRSAISPLVLHGPPGVGKTLLVSSLFQAVSQATPPRTVRLLAAADLGSDGPPDPARLTDLPPRLTNRFSAGLVIGMEPLSAASRRTLLHAMAKQENFEVGQGVLDWIADTTPGGARPLLGALAKLAMLARQSPLPL